MLEGMVGRGRREKHERELAGLDAFRHVRRVADEDVAHFGADLSALRVDRSSPGLDEGVRRDHRLALDAHDAAQDVLLQCVTSTDVTAVTRTLAEGRYRYACVVAARAGGERPDRRSPCFFDPNHGPAARELAWAPPGAVGRDLPVCSHDAYRLTGGEPPAIRQVRLGDRWVAWFASGPLYAAWAAGWYDDLIRADRVDAEGITMLFADAAGAPWTDHGSWPESGRVGGKDHTADRSTFDIGGSDGEDGRSSYVPHWG